MEQTDFLSPAPAEFKWPQCPEADQFIRNQVAEFLNHHSFAKRLADRMMKETSTEFLMWVDHLILPKKDFDASELESQYGFVIDRTAAVPKETIALWHPFADLPRLLLSSDNHRSCAIMVESITDFLLANDLSLFIQGTPFSTYRAARLQEENGELIIVERRGSRTYLADSNDTARSYVTALELWTNRRRHFENREAGLHYTQALANQLVRDLGTGRAAWAFLEGERRYWQKRNRAGQIQKARQDKLGLGWANHDHHTFRSSRAGFAALIEILKTFGFKKRERFYAGAEAGWGAQVMEQPEARLIIFADVDLTPEEVAVDFSSHALADLDKPGTIGLWCALHGESILEAGMHHLEAKFDFDHLKASLKNEQVNLMAPFSDFPHLRQAFTEGELWPVPLKRLDNLLSTGRLSKDAYDRIRERGAVGSHLENLQRRHGFKGFNQRGVSDIIRAVNPETQALGTEATRGGA